MGMAFEEMELVLANCGLTSWVQQDPGILN